MRAFFLCMCVVGIIYCLIMLWRNECVHRFRSKLIDQYHDANMREMRALFTPKLAPMDEWLAYDVRCNLRKKIFHSVTYEEMTRRWWKPLESFYTDEELRILTGGDADEEWPEIVNLESS